ncbi:MAG: hypothetical protein JWO19_5426 [Bryobacterales bacterium]|jgi:hypothetical protein|nr:hypothetical protein [Bryobacterales bacterium]
MDIVGAGLANLAGIMILALLAAGVAKAFQIAGTLSEIKELLADIKRTSDITAPTAPFGSTEAAESLLRAVSAELDHPVTQAGIELERKS